MQLFYATDIKSNTITLSEQESLHCRRVLRMNIGDEINMTDGKGNFYKGIIQLADDKRTMVKVLETTPVLPPPYQLHLYVAITKHTDWLEWMLEKCVEMGLSSFTPIITHRTERKKIRVDRLESIALSAMKQSLKAWLPEVHPVDFFSNLIKKNLIGSKLIAHCMDEIERKHIVDISINNEAHIFIGPEGDFTMDEVKLAIENGFNPVSMGVSRLRTETAGLIACSFMYLYNINTPQKLI